MTAAEQILKQYRIPVTGQRLAVLNLFLNSNEPLNHELLRKKMDKAISRYTIYRSLRLFLKRGVLHILPSQDGIIWYTLYIQYLQEQEQTHVHFICRQCGKIDFVPGISLPDLKQTGSHIIETVEVILKGYCSTCMQNS